MLDIRMIVSVEHRTLNLGENWNWYTLMKILSDDPEFWHFCNVAKQSCKTTTTSDGPGHWSLNRVFVNRNHINGLYTSYKAFAPVFSFNDFDVCGLQMCSSKCSLSAKNLLHESHLWPLQIFVRICILKLFAWVNDLSQDSHLWSLWPSWTV